MAVLSRWIWELGADAFWQGWLVPFAESISDHAAHIDWVPGDSAVSRLIVLTYAMTLFPLFVSTALTALWLLPLLFGAIPPCRLRPAFLAGLASAAVWLVADLLLRANARASLTAEVRASDSFTVVFTSWEIAGLVVVQFALAAVIAHRRSGLATALFACTVAGLLGSAALLGLHLTDGGAALWSAVHTRCAGTIDNVVAARPLGVVPVLGLPAALAGALLGRLTRRKKPPEPPAALSPPAVPPAVPRILPLTVAVVSIALTAFHPTASRDVLKPDEVGRGGARRSFVTQRQPAAPLGPAPSA
ncbi:hypothetical protein ABZ419_19075 [Streptomyces cinnamoneus]|uniref:hypothetical protein n=1 Tax=Streptomyces cinnamoneus TaxID=53446 RepID=UPI0033F9BFE4